MDLTSYSGLCAAVADYIARADLTTQIPGFVVLAERKFARFLRTIDLETTVVLTTAADGTFTLPSDSNEIRSLVTLGSQGAELSYLPEASAAVRNSRTNGGFTYGYTLSGTKLTIVPAAAVQATMIYTALLTPLSDANPSNWLLANHPDAYLYGTLAEYAVYNDPTQASNWQGQTAAALDEVRGSDLRRRWGRGRISIGCAP